LVNKIYIGLVARRSGGFADK